MTERDLMLNELAQGLRSMSQGIEWFEALGPAEQSETLRYLSHHCAQARAVTEDGPESIRRAGLRPTHTPAVLITHGRIDQQLWKIASLTPPDERRKAFRLLIALLAIADERRRARHCSDGCGHWWHNLSVADRSGFAPHAAGRPHCAHNGTSPGASASGDVPL
ncbi:DUF5958 family protein [Streptomyces sp. NPDC087420]|uniref:DUF5958 family protein n=1 Tax=Streptomyces sp. NPDC087420 TaxID=3365785 RepID=UPI00383632B5